MRKTKTHADAPDKASEPPAVQRQPDTPDREHGPSPAGRAPDARAAMRGAPVQARPAGRRAQMMRVLQKSVGNARLSRMMGAATAQRQEMDEEEPVQGRFAPAQRVTAKDKEPVQGKFTAVQRAGSEEEEPLQGKFALAQRAAAGQEEQMPAQRQAGEDGGAGETTTGMPGSLQAGLEDLSGMDLSGVRVHRNSSKPAQLNALAYTQGQDIHVAPGQEKHLPHEGWHAVQQMQGRVEPTIQEKGVSINDDSGLEREANVMGAQAVQKASAGPTRPGRKRPAAPRRAPAAISRRSAIQREMKFEFQVSKNRLWRNDGASAELLGRKYGPKDYLVKDESGVRLESERGGFVEFETKWFRSWPNLKRAVERAVEMTRAMTAAPPAGGGRRLFPFPVGHLRKGSRREMKRGYWDRKRGMEGRREKILGKGERLEVEVVDDKWTAAIQSSEGLLLEQYESYLREHEKPAYREPAILNAQAILDAVKPKGVPDEDVARLRGFLQMIVNYIMRGQRVDVSGEPSKYAFRLMSRTSFSSIYRSLLTRKEKRLFRKIVRKNTILDQLGLDRKAPFFFKGYGRARHYAGPTVYAWLRGIYRGRDLLAAGRPGISAAMGSKPVVAHKGKKDTGLVKFETRGTVKGRVREAKDWVDYAKALFKEAATARARKDKTGLRLKKGGGKAGGP